MSTPQIHLTFHGTIRDLLRRRSIADAHTFVYPLTRKASIKDIIEALGIPHTEVGRILSDADEQTFAFVPKGGEEIDVYPQSAGITVTEATVLRPYPVPKIKFMVDSTVGKLARLMRMAGLDVSSAQDGSLQDIATSAAEQKRIMLTRNTDLLKHRTMLFGHLIRNQQPELQLEEVIKLYNLASGLKPFSRCLICNNTLTSVAKEMILGQLQPLTQKHYNQFKQCNGCKRVYWRGSHCKRMEQVINRLAET